MTVLLVDSHADVLKDNSEYLKAQGYNILVASNMEAALPLAAISDFVVTDTTSRNIDGYKLAGIIKERHNVPVLFLAAPHSDECIERALACGGDYVKRPYSSKELYLRIEDLLKKTDSSGGGVLRLPPMHIDTRRLCVQVRGRELFLTPREYSLLMALCTEPNRVLTYEALFQGLWGSGDVSPHLVRQNISTLRRKLEKAAPDTRFIRTVHGSGYVFRFPPETVKR